MLANRISSKLLPRRHSDHLHSNSWFDNAAARWLRGRRARLFVGGETCSLKSLVQARQMGMKTILDCPGVPSTLLDHESQIAADHFGLRIRVKSNRSEMLQRKANELSLADVVLCCSDYQRRELTKLHPHLEQVIEVCPLWADVEFWRKAADQRLFSKPQQPLRVLYAGAISLRKGVPYLLHAMKEFSLVEVKLTLVGTMSQEMNNNFLKRFAPHDILNPVNRETLRKLFTEHDLLVMPTLGDSFGFIVLEAMASGLPVIVSDNAGAPVPDPNWRIAVHDSTAISQKLAEYICDRSLLDRNSQTAINFARSYTPQRYREQTGSIFRRLIETA